MSRDWAATMHRGMVFAVWLAAALHVLIVWARAFIAGRGARLASSDDTTAAGEPFVSILVPAWKERTVLAPTLEALKQQTYPHWEAIVIAGGPDGTEELARQVCEGCERFTVVQQPPRGKNAAFNLGYRHARGEVIVLLDADCVVESDWLAHLVAPLARGYDAALANYFPVNRSAVSDEVEMSKISAYLVRRSTVLHGGGIALRREVVEKLGGFPAGVTVGVDWDLDQRVTRLGLRKTFVPEAVHRTHLPTTLRQYYRDEVRWRRAHLQATARFYDGTLAGATAALGALGFYITGALFSLAPAAALALGRAFPVSLHLWLAFTAWVLLRRSALALEVFGHTGDWRWLGRIWVPPLLLIVSFVSAVVATATVNRRPVFFQGQRPK